MFFVINDLFGLAMLGNMNEIGDPVWLLSLWMLLHSDTNMLLRERRVWRWRSLWISATSPWWLQPEVVEEKHSQTSVFAAQFF